jgi:hypothetical protein
MLGITPNRFFRACADFLLSMLRSSAYPSYPNAAGFALMAREPRQGHD